MNEQKTQFVGTGSTNNRIIEKQVCHACQKHSTKIISERAIAPPHNCLEVENQNLRTLMQALHGCRKNCAECKEEEWEPKIIQKEARHE